MRSRPCGRYQTARGGGRALAGIRRSGSHWFAAARPAGRRSSISCCRWYEPHLRAHSRRRARAPGRSPAARADRLDLSEPGAVPDRAHARSAGGHQRPRRRSAARRGLSRFFRPSIRPRARNGSRSTFSTSSTAAFRRTSPPGRSAEIEEERRLLYVAMTRAKDQLHLIVPQRFFVHGQRSNGDRHLYASRTRFIPDSVARKFRKLRVAARRRRAAGGQIAARAGRYRRARAPKLGLAP